MAKHTIDTDNFGGDRYCAVPYTGVRTCAWCIEDNEADVQFVHLTNHSTEHACSRHADVYFLTARIMIDVTYEEMCENWDNHHTCNGRANRGDCYKSHTLVY